MNHRDDRKTENGVAANVTTGTQLLTYRDVAAWLSVSESYLRRLVMHRKIPNVKIGRAVRFRPVDIKQWIEQHHRS